MQSINKQSDYLILFLASGLVFAFYSCIDQPQALQKPMLQQPYNLSESRFNLIYTMTCSLNIIICLIGGIFIDWIGLKYSLVIFACITLIGISNIIGQSISVISTLFLSNIWYYLFLLGRILFGVGSQNSMTCQSCAIVKFINPKKVATYIGIAQTSPIILDALNSLVSPILFSLKKQLWIPLIIGIGFCIFSLVCAIVLANKLKYSIYQTNSIHGPPKSCQQLQQFKCSFWLLSVLIIICQGLFLAYLDNANDMFVTRFNFTYISAGKLLMIPYIFASFTPIIWGLMFARFSRQILILFTMSLFSLSHLIIFLQPDVITGEPGYGTYIPLSLSLSILGVSYSGFMCTIMGSIPYIVDQKYLATAFGIAASSQSISQTLLPIIGMQVLNNSQREGFHLYCLLYVGISIFGITISSSIFFQNVKSLQEIEQQQQNKQQFQSKVQ